MKVVLVKQDMVDFNLSEDKCEKISHKTFRMLTGYQEGETAPDESPKMVVFKTKEEYQAEAYKYNLDLNKEVLINSKGNIFCYLAEDPKTPINRGKSKSEEDTDATTNTEENQGE